MYDLDSLGTPDFAYHIILQIMFIQNLEIFTIYMLCYVKYICPFGYHILFLNLFVNGDLINTSTFRTVHLQQEMNSKITICSEISLWGHSYW